MTRLGFTKQMRLLRTADYRKVYAEGKRRNLGWAIAFCRMNGRDSSRVGFTVPRAFGAAVARNRIKRRLREAVRKNWQDLAPGWDIVLNPRRVALDIEFEQIGVAIRSLFQSCKRNSRESGSISAPALKQPESHLRKSTV